MHSTATSLFETYAASAGLYDEMLEADGQLRPHWRQFRGLVDGLGLEEFSRRWEQAQTQLYENGMAYGVHGDDESGRPASLGPRPAAVADSRRPVADGVRRAGPTGAAAELDSGRPVRPAAVADPWLVASRRSSSPIPDSGVPITVMSRPDGRYLHIYSADLARSPDGTWWVLADRTEAPSGMGHVLENRIVLSRMLPDVFHTCQIERLAPYFIALRESLTQLAPHHRENPRIVLLSPGPGTPSYFEDAYLARYLGYTLVQGSDLTVRNSRVMLKTLGGLVPVDVILRRTNSESCDPLELDGQGTGGPVGLLQADPRRTGGRGQCLGRRAGGIARVPGVHAATLRATARRTAEDAQYRHLVVR